MTKTFTILAGAGAMATVFAAGDAQAGAFTFDDFSEGLGKVSGNNLGPVGTTPTNVPGMSRALEWVSPRNDVAGDESLQVLAQGSASPLEVALHNDSDLRNDTGSQSTLAYSPDVALASLGDRFTFKVKNTTTDGVGIILTAEDQSGGRNTLDPVITDGRAAYTFAFADFEDVDFSGRITAFVVRLNVPNGGLIALDSIHITPIPGAALLFAPAIAGLVYMRRRQQTA